jgi:hypothetical protein
MKKKYKLPEVIIELLEKEDVLTDSPERGEDTIDNPGSEDGLDDLFA